MAKKIASLSLIFVSTLVLFFSVFGEEKRYYSLKERIEAQEQFLKGFYHYNNMEYTSSIEFFRKSLDFMPLNERARYWLGKAYLMAGYKELAVSEWESLVRLDAADLLLRQKLQQLYTESFMDQKVDLQNSFVFLKYLFSDPGVSSIELDSDNNLYISTFLRDRVNVLDPNFNEKRTLKSSLEKPMDISLNNDYLAVASFGNDSVVLFDRKTGKSAHVLGGFGLNTGKMAGPSGVFLTDKKLYVCETGNNRVQVFRLDPEPQFLMTFGEKGRGPGQFLNPSDLIFHQNKIWVADTRNRRIQVFDDSGNFLYQFGENALEKPRKIMIYENKIYVLDENKGLLRYIPEKDSFDLIQGLNQDIQKPIGAGFDKNGVFYIGDFFTNRISVFAPDKMKLSSVKLNTILTLNTGYPTIAVKMRVQDIQGRDIPGLTSQNFTVFQEDRKMPGINVFPVSPEGNRLSVVTLIRTSSNMKKYRNEIVDYFRKITEDFNALDQVAITHYNNTSTLAQPFTNQKLKMIEALNKTEFTNTQNDVLDVALYKSVTRNLNNEHFNYILLFEDGKSNTDFPKYSLEVIGNYAKRNGVPIYVMAMEEGPLTPHLKYLAKESGGKYLNFFKSNEIYSIVPQMRKNPPLFYVLTYQSPQYSKVNQNRWLNVRIELNYKNLYGVDKTGYFIP
jgi:tetratricopeptide (TPR) repeat protein